MRVDASGDGLLPKSTGALAGLSLAFAFAVGCHRSPPPQPLPPDGKLASTTPVPTAAPAKAKPLPQELPASFAGLLPCADCEGIRYELDLRADQVYFSRMTYLGKPAPNTFDEVGHWSLADDQVLTLNHGSGSPEQWSMLDVTSLRKLDAQGQPIASQHNLAMTRQADYQPIEPSLELRGMYRHGNDGGVFEECQTGMKLDIAPGSNRDELDSAYAKARQNGADTVLATVRGRIVGNQGEPRADQLVIESFKSLAANETCGAIGVTHDLEGTRWVLVRLNEEAIGPESSQREPYIVLEPTEHRVSGHGGCNRIVGRYERTGQTIHFTELAMTRMACPEMQIEDAFQKALTSTVNWSIEADQLKLLDASGAIAARFEARNLL